MADDLERTRQRRQRRAAKAGAFGPSTRKRQAIDRVMAQVDDAALRRDPAAYFAGQTPTPERITMALDIQELYGPEVDRALGGEEPMVDEWDAGTRVPSLEQVQALYDKGWSIREIAPKLGMDRESLGKNLKRTAGR